MGKDDVLFYFYHPRYLFPAAKSQILKLDVTLQRNVQLDNDYRWTEKRPLGLVGTDLTEGSLASQHGNKGNSHREKRDRKLLLFSC